MAAVMASVADGGQIKVISVLLISTRENHKIWDKIARKKSISSLRPDSTSTAEYECSKYGLPVYTDGFASEAR
jgi:hypothetical protein